MRLGVVRGVALIGVVAVLVQAAVAIPVGAADGFNGAHWERRKTPFELKFGDNVDNGWDGYLKKAAGQWSQSRVVRPNIVNGSAGGDCRPTEGRVEVCNGRYGTGKGWLGLTEIWVNGRNHITAARVLMNDSWFDSGKYDDADAKRHTMCHELGHSLGLDHRSGRSCMNDSEKAIFRYDDPAGSDFDTLRQRYRHSDDGSTVDSVATTSFTPADFDPAIPDLPKGKDVVVKDLSNGGKRITIVTWPE